VKTLLAGFLILSAPVLQAATLLAGKIRNAQGSPIAGLTIHFYRNNGAGFDHQTAVTGADGKWQIDLPPGTWRGAAHTDDLLARGYFCYPGFVWRGESGDFGNDFGIVEGRIDRIDFPPLWGGGLIEWNPVIDPLRIVASVIPTRPDLSVEHPTSQGTGAGVRVGFETTLLNMTTVRQWRIEKSTDLTTWVPLQTVALSGPSPVVVPDPTSAAVPACYYRAVQVEDLVPTP